LLPKYQDTSEEKNKRFGPTRLESHQENVKVSYSLIGERKEKKRKERAHNNTR
jgi:hypothetical protein